jgi:hypothetical protein
MNGANVLKVAENHRKTTFLAAHSQQLMKNQCSQYLGALSLVINSTRNGRRQEYP